MARAEGRTACINALSRKIFAPMFRARWQNMQNIVNDSAFIDMIPEPYVSYYMAYIRQCIQWSTGFVPMLHRGDFFSTGIGYTVCDILVKECMKGSYRLTSTNKDLKKALEKWEDTTNLYNELSRMFWNTNAGGNCLLVLTPVERQAYLTAYPINRCFFQIGRNGKVTSATLLNRFVAGETAVYARERRRYLDGKAYYKVEIASGTLVVSPTWTGQGLAYVPDKVKDQFEYAYGDIKLNTWYELPFNSIGVYNVKNKPVSVAIADMPGYSDSSLYTALDVLYSIDFNYTQAQVDMYLGRGRGILPKQWQRGNVNTGNSGNVVNGESFADALARPSLEEVFYTEITDSSGNAVKPTIMQADLRGEAHKYIRDADLELLASKVGLSSSTLANHLTYNSSKTATEVKDEQDTTETTIGDKRKLANESINDMLKDVASFYGFTDDCEIEWGRTGTTSTENQELLAEFQAGTLSLRQYLRLRHKDLSEEEVELWAQEIEKETEKKNSLGFNDKDYFGDLEDEDSKQALEQSSAGAGNSGNGNPPNS